MMINFFGYFVGPNVTRHLEGIHSFSTSMVNFEELILGPTILPHILILYSYLILLQLKIVVYLFRININTKKIKLNLNFITII